MQGARKKKPIPCRFWMQGKCHYGDNCEYMHSMGNEAVCNIDLPIYAQPAVKAVPAASSVAPVSVNLNFAISPILFGNGVVSFNHNHGVYFGAILPEDFFATKETEFLKYLKRDLNLLLRMPFNHFVSHLIMDEDLKKTLFSFMLYSPRIYDERRIFCQFA